MLSITAADSEVAGRPAAFGEVGAGASEALAARERRQLVRLCARLTGDSAIAEDLAQEALLRAHRSRERLRAPELRQAWLDGIARHVCLDWIRRRRRERQLFCAHPLPDPPGALDLDRELDRHEIVSLLDRAMDRLPEATRAVLMDHYVSDFPQSDIALRHGCSEGAVAMRLQRGRQMLRDLLLTDFRADATELGLVNPGDAPGWRPTRLWCTTCGVRRLRARFQPDWGIHLECPDCTRGQAVLLRLEGYTPFGEMATAQLFAGVHGVRRAVDRVSAELHRLLGNGLPGVWVRCCVCGKPAPVRVGGPYGDIEMVCEHGGYRPGLSGIGGVAACHPAALRFTHRHARVWAPRPRFLEAAGTRAVLFTYESLTSADRIHLLYAHTSMVLLGVWGDIPGRPATSLPPDLARPSAPSAQHA